MRDSGPIVLAHAKGNDAKIPLVLEIAWVKRRGRRLCLHILFSPGPSAPSPVWCKNLACTVVDPRSGYRVRVGMMAARAVTDGAFLVTHSLEMAWPQGIGLSPGAILFLETRSGRRFLNRTLRSRLFDSAA